MKIWTIPNLVSFSRLLGVPLIIWLGLTNQSTWWLFIIFVAGGFTDWLDGWLARKLNQQSKLGAELDPIADRLYILASLVVLYAQQLIPTWVLGLIVLRDLVMMGHIWQRRQLGFAPPSVHYVGKAGTMMLLYSIPLVFLGAAEWPYGWFVRYFAIGFLIWGVVTYWYAAWLYFWQFRQVRYAN